MAKKDIAKIIKETRAAFGLTQEQLAAKIGVTFSTVNRWENNKGKPSPLAQLRIEELQKEFSQKNSLKQKSEKEQGSKPLFHIIHKDGGLERQ